MALDGEEARQHAARPARPARRAKVDQRALSARYPSWGPATLSLLVAGLLVGYPALFWLGPDAMHRCAAEAGCNPRMRGLMLALPVLATALGLAVSLIGARVLARTGRSPLVATAVGWAVFLVALVVAAIVVLG